MKVLFAVNNENISESIIKKYQQEYKEIISVKNVYYFNAIIKELQRDKSYDRIVVSEDLQPFSNNNYEQIDKFIFEKMDNISDEATNQSGNDIPIILICTDRREKSDPLLVKLFGIGVYNALLGKDRSITNVCELLARPRSKKEAKVYYRIDPDDVDYKVENEGDVSENEIQNIVNYYKKLGDNQDQYVSSFEHIASQYTDAQLRLIANFLPLKVKAVLEANSLRYQEIVSFGGSPKVKNKKMDNVPMKNTKSVKQEEPKTKDMNLDFIEQNLNKSKITEPVIIPNAINNANVRKIQETPTQMPNQNAQNEQTNINGQIPQNSIRQPQASQMGQNSMQQVSTNQQNNQNRGTQGQSPIQQTPVKIEPEQIQEIDDILDALPTGESTTISEAKEIPNQVQSVEEMSNTKQDIEQMQSVQQEEVAPKRGRGRPKKVQVEPVSDGTPKRGRGRPKKVVEPIQNQQVLENNNVEVATPVNLFELGEEDTNTAQNNDSTNDMVLPGLDDESLFEEIEQNMPEGPVGMIPEVPADEEEYINQFPFGAQENNNQESFNNQNQMPYETVAQGSFEEQANNAMPFGTQEKSQPSFGNNIQQANSYNIAQGNNSYANNMQSNYQDNFGSRAVENTNQMSSNLASLLTNDKKVVAFVGTSKNGTSFLVNNVAELLSQKGINTAVLDLTKNKNAYYIYTENEEEIRKTAYTCIEELRRGNAKGIQVHKNLTVYTTLPGENDDIEDYNHILETLIQNYSLVILDCDFETNYNYFREVQELYLVQSLDVLTIQPLTAFLRNLKAKGALEPEKIRVVLNKVLKLRSISEKTIIGGMAFYNDPAMSFMTELFNKDTVLHCSIPFEEQAYAKYLEGLINCKISLNGYSKNFMAILNNLGDMVYPLINNKGNTKNYNNYNPQNNFSSNMNDTLNKMKNSY